MTTRLEIVSDIVCPWCYLGAANLMRALAGLGDTHPFAIRWLPFLLDPTMPPEGKDRAAHMAAKFGSDPSRLEAAHARLQEMGAAVGLDYHFEKITRAPSSIDAHRLIRWAEPEGLQTRVAMVLFARYFERGEDISDPGVLVAAAEEAGMEGAVVARLLAGDADRAEVRAEAGQASAMGVTGVPTFVLGGRYALSGAQPVEAWERVIRDIEAAAVQPS